VSGLTSLIHILRKGFMLNPWIGRKRGRLGYSTVAARSKKSAASRPRLGIPCEYVSSVTLEWYAIAPAKVAAELVAAYRELESL
jgi:hypothetical protein